MEGEREFDSAGNSLGNSGSSQGELTSEISIKSLKEEFSINFMTDPDQVDFDVIIDKYATLLEKLESELQEKQLALNQVLHDIASDEVTNKLDQMILRQKISEEVEELSTLLETGRTKSQRIEDQKQELKMQIQQFSECRDGLASVFSQALYHHQLQEQKKQPDQTPRNTRTVQQVKIMNSLQALKGSKSGGNNSQPELKPESEEYLRLKSWTNKILQRIKDNPKIKKAVEKSEEVKKLLKEQQQRYNQGTGTTPRKI